jgi:glucosamine--fructose-6-phosphate aminotransferase (isomerizing)
MALIDEIREQPSVARRLLAEWRRSDLEGYAQPILPQRPAFALLAARGTSDNAALYAQYLLAVRNDLVAALATPSTITLYGARPRMNDALVVGISQSGRSPDIVAVLEEAARQGASTVAITNDTSSPLALAASHVIDLMAGPEKATAATKTYTAELLAVTRLSAMIDPLTDAEGAALGRVPDLMESALATEPGAQVLAAHHAERNQAIVLGRGYGYATAREWALKMQELAQLPALAYSAADFEHGPLALAEPGLAVMAVAPSGVELDAQMALLRRLQRDHGARLLVISDDPDARRLDEGLPLPEGVGGWIGPIIEIIPAQLFTYHLTSARGLDPDQPRTITKVTRTV